ncbi:MAG: NAD(P)H-dependent oxidoreductase [Candidatus Magnetobacterium sp. LHC-1]|uniref:NAD(P)H-dependent oxidoreductase n=1 Tax=Candidatus Magnetobacterium casense TaxID=1455061 RepID=A0ABS6RVH5_9BACT|nr:NAD(P)H-dependent oxidoreductase [Candidatus Magnetobacterium casensis]MBF0606609.1 NAD(P)H-dependent oxidoreductase [Nitrospirota bacterium]MBV6340014.1 NAD(P)H-dependent oxidoreductase [Candidatus Magnetobacterium casensis]
MREAFLNAMQYRHACKVFDESKEVSEDDLRFILEAGRLSPSSFGLEQWRFIVARSGVIKQRLMAACFNQQQLTTCSVVVSIVAKVQELTPGSDYVTRMFKRRNYPPEIYQWIVQFYESYYRQTDTLPWSIMQCHIAAANMMTAAAFIGIDSCPIGGFEPQKVRDVLQLDTSKEDIALIIPLGHRKLPQPPVYRLPFEEVVQYI